MIINYERGPEYSLYYIGAKIMQNITTRGGEGSTLDDIYEKVSSEYNNEISIMYFYLALDWLFMLNAIKINDNKVMKYED